MQTKQRRKKPKSRVPAKSPPYDPTVAKFTLRKGTQVELRRRGEKKWQPHTMRRTVEMRTKKRRGDTLYMEYLGFEVRFTAAWIARDTRFNRY